jgi:hypothetical protein
MRSELTGPTKFHRQEKYQTLTFKNQMFHLKIKPFALKLLNKKKKILEIRKKYIKF